MTFSGTMTLSTGANDIEFRDGSGTLGASISAGPVGTWSAGDSSLVRMDMGDSCYFDFRRTADVISGDSGLSVDMKVGGNTMHLNVEDNGAAGALLIVSGGLQHASGPLGFFGHTPTTRPTITGTVGSTAWATSIENALVALGLASR